MKFKELFQQFFTGQKKTPTPIQTGMQADKFEMMEKILTMLSETREEELTCDQVFAALDQFTELAARGEDVSQLMPLVQHHLEMCSDCMEEYKVLKNIVLNTAH
jgi:predicted component of type VI protein secretion system